MKNKSTLLKYGLFLTIFIIFVVFWHFIAAPYILKIPQNFSYNADLVSRDNFYNPVEKKFEGEQRTRSVFSYEAYARHNGVLSIQNSLDVQKPTGEKIISITRDYGIDAYTGMHVFGYGDRNREGYLFAPRFLHKQDFTYWHVNYNTPIEMKFSEEQALAGVRVYKYMGTIFTDQSDELLNLPGVPTERKVVVQGTISLWVEPISGHLVSYEDVAQANFVDRATGKTIEPWNSFRNTFTEASVVLQAGEAEQQKIKILFVEYGGVLIVFVLGLGLLWARNTKTGRVLHIEYGDSYHYILKMLVTSLVFIVCILGVLYFWNRTSVESYKKDNVVLNTHADVVQKIVQLQYVSYEDILRAVNLALSSKSTPSGDVLNKYINELDITHEYPGLKNIGYVEFLNTKGTVLQESLPTPARGGNFSYRELYVVPGYEVNNGIFNNVFTGPYLSDLLKNDYLENRSMMFTVVGTLDQTRSLVLFLPHESKDSTKKRYIYGIVNANEFFANTNGSFDKEIDYAVFEGKGLLGNTKVFDSNIKRGFNEYSLVQDDGPLSLLRTIKLGDTEWTVYYSEKQINGFRFLQGFIFTTLMIVFVSLFFVLLYLYYVYFLRYRVSVVVGKERIDSLAKEQEVVSENKLLKEERKDLNERIKSLEGKVFEAGRTRVAMLNVLDEVAFEKSRSDALAKDLEKFKLAVGNASESVIITDADGVILYVNKEALKTIGYTEKEVMGNKPSLWGRQMSKEFYEEMWRIIKVERRTYVGEVTNVRKDGSRYLATLKISPILDELGKVQFFISLERDITLSRHAQEQERHYTQELKKIKESIEKEVRIKTKQLGDEKARLMASINSLSFGFVMVDINGNIILSNPSVLKILGVRTAPGTIDDLARYFALFNVKQKSRECVTFKKIIEIKDAVYRNKDLRIVFVPVFNDNIIIGHAIVMEDITEAKIIERSRDEFFAVASHELRTPLTAIRGNTEMILDMYGDKITDASIKEMLADIDEGSIRLINIVNDFLEVSRLEQGNIVLDNSNFNLSETIEDVVKVIQMNQEVVTKGLKIKFEKTAGQEAFPVFTDMDKVKQILFNLIGNAIKFTKEGSVTVYCEKEKDFIKVRVVDTGIGVSVLNERLLFRKFQPAGEEVLRRDVTKSTGLGLYISKLIIERMGGTIGLETSDLGKGSTFFFTIPLRS